MAHTSYLDYFSQHYPRITEFLDTTGTSANNYAQSQTSQKSIGTSLATSGISSMQPSNRKKSNRQKIIPITIT